MENKIMLVAETGSDLTPELAEEYGITLVPMHVSMGNQTLDDGTFPPEEVCAYYDRTGKVPQTSGSSPNDFETVFERLHTENPEANILHMAYSAVTTCSYQSAVVAAEGREFIASIDTKHVSVGQAVAVMETARWLKEHPDSTLEEAAEAGREISARVKMVFMPDNLDYLRAGGRVSNAVALVGNLLNLHPCIEIIDGKLIAKKKYRGTMSSIAPKLLEDFTKNYNIDPQHLYFIWSAGLADDIKQIAEQKAWNLGYPDFTWMKTGCVITCHGGPNAFGVVGLSRA